MAGRIHVRRKCVPQVGIKVRKSRAIGDDIERPLESGPRGGIESEVRMADVSLDDFDFFLQERGELRALYFLQAVERRRFFDDFLETLLRRGRAVSTDQQRNLPNEIGR